MATYIDMPKLSDTMTEGTVVAWRKKVGEQVRIGDVLADIETDKAVMEMEAFEEGILNEVFVPEGGKAKVGDKLALIVPAGEEGTEHPARGAAPPKSTPSTAKQATAGTSQQPPSKVPSTPVGTESQGRIKASPLAKKIAARSGVDLGGVTGSGPGGRIVARDVEQKASAPKPAAKKAAAPVAVEADAETRIPHTGMRRAIAERLTTSKLQSPHFYMQVEINAEPLTKLRAEVNAAAEKAGLAKITINDFILKAASLAAVKVPRVNASYTADAIVEYKNVHLAVAVAVEDGLVTPVIRTSQNKSLREISDAVKDFAERARQKKLHPDEYQGGTITVSNLGSYGIERFSAIINPPQAVILAVGAISKKPVVNEKDEIVVGQRMVIGLSADHRVVDGAVAANYMNVLRQLLENPLTLLL